MIRNYPFFANLLELRKEQFERNTAHMNLSKEEKDRRWRVFEQQQAAEMAMAMQAMNGQSNFSAFESTWKTDNFTGANVRFITPLGIVTVSRTSSASPSNSIRLPLVSNGTYNFYVDWGDGKVDLITRWDQPEVTHTYPAIGTYNVKILGSIIGWNFNFNGEANKIIRINKWGCLRFVDPTGSTTSGFFCGCNALDLTQVSDTPFLKNISSVRNMFNNFWQERSQGTSPPIINKLNEWDVSSIQDFSGMFAQNNYFNQNIGNWDVSNARDMSFMFASYVSVGGTQQKGFFDNGGSNSIGGWNVSNVTNMNGMFQFQGFFNRTIGNWDVSKVTNFSKFMSALANIGTNGNGIFNQPLNWNPRSAVNMSEMFLHQTAFNQDIGGWDVSKVQDFSSFLEIPFFTNAGNGAFNNGGADTLKNWNTSSATNMFRMFRKQTQFNQNIGTWDVSKVTNMQQMFAIGLTSGIGSGVFNNGGSDSIRNWNVSSVTTFLAAFYNQPSFNQPIGEWQPSACRILDYMFGRDNIGQGFNQSINGWGAYTGNVVSMQGMFYRNSSYNQPMDQWNTANVIDMQLVFNDATAFNQNIGAWNVGNVIRMDSMFDRTTAGAGGFNNGGSSDINNWNMINVRRVTAMFRNQTSFNQPLGNWNIANIGAAFTWTTPTGGSAVTPTGSISLATNRGQAFQNFMTGKTFNDYSTTNYDALWIGWASRASQTNIQINFGITPTGIRRTAASSAARAIFGPSPNRAWTITDGGTV